MKDNNKLLTDAPEKNLKKPGKLSLSERQYIEENCGRMQIDSIADKLNRHSEPIKRYIRENNLTYVRQNENSLYIDLYQKLKERFYYKDLKKQFTEEELETFSDMWVETFKQFKENILPTEEFMLKQWITIEILSNRSMCNRKNAIMDIERLQKIINEEYEKPEIERDWSKISNLETQVGLAKAAQQGYTTEHSKLTADAKSLARELKGTREGRLLKHEETKSTFMGLIKSLEEEEVRERESMDGGLMLKAVDKARKKYSSPHKYLDLQIDLPILNSSTIKEYEDAIREQDEKDRLEENQSDEELNLEKEVENE